MSGIWVRWGVLAGALALAACGGGVHYRPVSDVPVRVGKPYAVRGTTYVPAADPSYDMLGYASWYGSESGNQTANGERFRPKAVSAAHTTLPLPSYVEVTSLDSGRTILVRVNDRGPFAGRGRIIDLSRGAAMPPCGCGWWSRRRRTAPGCARASKRRCGLRWMTGRWLICGRNWRLGVYNGGRHVVGR
jgi:hypothetical protein